MSKADFWEGQGVIQRVALRGDTGAIHSGSHCEGEGTVLRRSALSIFGLGAVQGVTAGLTSALSDIERISTPSSKKRIRRKKGGCSVCATAVPALRRTRKKSRKVGVAGGAHEKGVASTSFLSRSHTSSDWVQAHHLANEAIFDAYRGQVRRWHIQACYLKETLRMIQQMEGLLSAVEETYSRFQSDAHNFFHHDGGDLAFSRSRKSFQEWIKALRTFGGPEAEASIRKLESEGLYRWGVDESYRSHNWIMKGFSRLGGVDGKDWYKFLKKTEWQREVLNSLIGQKGLPFVTDVESLKAYRRITARALSVIEEMMEWLTCSDREVISYAEVLISRIAQLLIDDYVEKSKQKAQVSKAIQHMHRVQAKRMEQKISDVEHAQVVKSVMKWVSMTLSVIMLALTFWIIGPSLAFAVMAIVMVLNETGAVDKICKLISDDPKVRLGLEIAFVVISCAICVGSAYYSAAAAARSGGQTALNAGERAVLTASGRPALVEGERVAMEAEQTALRQVEGAQRRIRLLEQQRLLRGGPSRSILDRTRAIFNDNLLPLHRTALANLDRARGGARAALIRPMTIRGGCLGVGGGLSVVASSLLGEINLIISKKGKKKGMAKWLQIVLALLFEAVALLSTFLGIWLGRGTTLGNVQGLVGASITLPTMAAGGVSITSGAIHIRSSQFKAEVEETEALLRMTEGFEEENRRAKEREQFFYHNGCEFFAKVLFMLSQANVRPSQIMAEALMGQEA